MDVQGGYSSLPNVLAMVGEQALVKRSTVYEIIKRSGRAQDFLNNPQLFIEQAANIILNVRRSLAVEGICYQKRHGEEYCVQEIFDSTKMIANLKQNAVAVAHSVYDHIVYDSAVERRFAIELDHDPDVKLFFKLPSRFKVDTPLGGYTPDWVIYMEIDGLKKLCFVIETKGSSDQLALRLGEDLKIQCGKAHFKALGTGVELHGPISDWTSFKMKI